MQMAMWFPSRQAALRFAQSLTPGDTVAGYGTVETVSSSPAFTVVDFGTVVVEIEEA